MAYGIKAVDDEPAGCPRWIALTAVVCISVFGVILLRMTLGVGLAYAHYQSVPDFATYIAEHPVSPERALTALPPGEVLVEDEAWELGDLSAGEDAIELGSVCHIRMKRGEESLLDARLDLVGMADRETYAVHGFRALPPELDVREGMRSCIQVGLLEPEALLESTDGSRQVIVDAVLVSGEGPDLFRVVRLDRIPDDLEGLDLGLTFLRAMMGWIHPPGELPEEGLVAHARMRFFTDWSKQGGSVSGPSWQPSQVETNYSEYSLDVELELEGQEDGENRISARSGFSRTYRWNESVW